MAIVTFRKRLIYSRRIPEKTFRMHAIFIKIAVPVAELELSRIRVSHVKGYAFCRHKHRHNPNYTLKLWEAATKQFSCEQYIIPGLTAK